MIDSITTIYDQNKQYLRLDKKDSHIVSIILKDNVVSNLDEAELLIEKGIKILYNLKGNKDLYFIEGRWKFEKELTFCLSEYSSEINDSSKLVYTAVSKALKSFECEEKSSIDLIDIFDTKRRANEYAIDLTSEILNVEDYLVAKIDSNQSN